MKDGKVNTDNVTQIEKPLIEVDHFAYLKVIKSNRQGVFVDMGASKHLFVPNEEQIEEMIPGNRYLVFMFLEEETNKLVGSCKVDDFVFFDEIDVKRGDQVNLLFYRTSDMGMNAIVNNLYKGLLFRSDIHKEVNEGDTIKGYVKNIREDGKIDLVLEPLGYKKSIDATIKIILEKLEANNGALFLTDKSSPNEIKTALGLSKKAFKRSIGNLYKKRMINLFDDRIEINHKKRP